MATSNGSVVNMDEREELIKKLRHLLDINKQKQKEYFEKEKEFADYIGCLTKEMCEFIKLYPKMQSLNITWKDINTERNDLNER